MSCHLVTYDLNKPGQNYNDLYEAIKTFTSWCHCLDSTWIILSELTSEQIRNHISPYIDSNDSLLIVELSGEAAWIGISDECSKWLKNNL